LYTKVNEKEYKYPFYLLKLRKFLPFFLTQFLGALNDNVLKLSVLTLIAFHLVHGAEQNQMYQALGAGLFTLPFFLFSAIAGQWADKYDKAILMRYIKGSEVFLMLLGGIGIYLENIPWMMTIIFFIGVHSAFFGPLKYGILPEHLQEKELLAGNGFVDAATFIAILVGTLLGSLLIPQEAVFLKNGLKFVCFTLVGIALLGLISSFFIPSTKKNSRAKNIDLNIFRSTYFLFKASKKYPPVFSAILGISWFWFLGATLLTEFPSYVQYTLNADKSVFTLFLALFSIGIAVGSLLVNRCLKGRISTQYAFIAALLMSLFIMDLSFNSQHFLLLDRGRELRICVDLFLLSVCGGMYITPLYAVIQKHSPSQWCSRMIAVNNIMNSAFMVASAIWVAVLALCEINITTIFLSLIIGNIFFGWRLQQFAEKSAIKSILTFIFKYLYRVEVKGIENYEQAGDHFLILLPYSSFMDILLLTLFLPDSLGVVLEKSWEKKSWIKPFLSWSKVSFIDAFNPMASRSMLKAAKNNQKFILTPESYVTGDLPLKKMIEISRFIVRKTAAPLLPIEISGTLLLPFSRRNNTVPRRLFPKVVINIHSLVSLESKNKTQTEHAISHQLVEMLFNISPWKNSLFKQLLEMRAIYPKRLIVEDMQKKLSYSTLVLQSFVLGSAMAKQSKQGEYIGILLPTMVTSAVCFFALQAFGRIPALLNFSLGAHSLTAACKLAKIKTIYTSSAFVEQIQLENSITALKELGITIVYLEEFKEKISVFNRIEGFFRHIFSLPVPVKPEDPAVVLFTSGSEGLPKGVVLSHQNLLANTYQLASCVDFSSHDHLFNALPIFHCFGLTAGMILPLSQGFGVFLYPSPLHYKMIPEWVRKAGATFFLATDTFLKGYANYTQLHHFEQVRGIFAGAEKVKEETIKTWKHTFETPIFEGYGMTEAAPVIAVNNHLRYKEGSVGCLLPGMQYRLEPVEGLSEGGRLWVSGPNVMLGYLNAEGGVAPLSADGWYDTGDIADVDDEGFMTLLGRARRFAKIGGEMVSFSAVENVLTNLWPEHLHAVLSKQDDKKGEALVLLTNNPEAKRELIVHYMRQKGHAEILTPKQVVILPEMPLLATGKIDYVALKEIV
jgi:acyl-[acyl-carrier-protein]-phospholipid O-acyltransferase/long-chain-fatty-acid--[acyl-carrier-protein] ligase